MAANKPQISPLYDRVVIEPIEREEQTETGILLPETAERERPQQGTVIAVGPGKRLDSGELAEPTVKEGQKVLFTKYGPNEITVGDTEYLIAREDDILAVLEE